MVLIIVPSHVKIGGYRGNRATARRNRLMSYGVFPVARSLTRCSPIGYMGYKFITLSEFEGYQGYRMFRRGYRNIVILHQLMAFVAL
jgi:hypothetical protein